MKKFSFTTAAGILALILGCLWVFAFLFQPLLRLFTGNIKLSFFYYLFLMLVLSVPGIMAAYNGFKLIRQKNKKYIKGSAGALCIFGVFLASAITGSVFGIFIESKMMFFLLLAAVIILPTYILLSKFLMKREGLTPIKGEFIGRGVMQIIALLIWISGSTVIDSFKLMDQGNVVLALVSGLAPLIIAVVFYDIATKIIEKNNAKQAVDHVATATPAPE
jgi:hypothetical protein